MTSQEVINLITAMYMWFNQIANPVHEFKKQDLEKYFTPNFIMQMNEEIITSDYNTLFDHFTKFRKSGKILKVILPPDEVFMSDDMKKCVFRYNIEEIFPDKTSKIINVIAIWHISTDGKLERMNEVVYENPHHKKASLN